MSSAVSPPRGACCAAVSESNCRVEVTRAAGTSVAGACGAPASTIVTRRPRRRWTSATRIVCSAAAPGDTGARGWARTTGGTSMRGSKLQGRPARSSLGNLLANSELCLSPSCFRSQSCFSGARGENGWVLMSLWGMRRGDATMSVEIMLKQKRKSRSSSLRRHDRRFLIPRTPFFS